MTSKIMEVKGPIRGAIQNKKLHELGYNSMLSLVVVDKKFIKGREMGGRHAISIQQLETFFCNISEALKRLSVTKVEISDPLYWDLWFLEQFTMTQDPEVNVGDLEDDLGFLKKDELAYTASASYIAKFSSLLRYLAKNIDDRGL